MQKEAEEWKGSWRLKNVLVSLISLLCRRLLQLGIVQLYKIMNLNCRRLKFCSKKLKFFYSYTVHSRALHRHSTLHHCAHKPLTHDKAPHCAHSTSARQGPSLRARPWRNRVSSSLSPLPGLKKVVFHWVMIGENSRIFYKKNNQWKSS